VDKLTVFNIGGNKYRLVTYIDYPAELVFIRSILTHEEYSTGRWKNDPWNR
jgi:mRNA interferase HigB